MSINRMRQQVSQTINDVTEAAERIQTASHDLPVENDRTATQDVLAHLAADTVVALASVVKSLVELRDAVTQLQSGQ